jgi:hypothetical protein
MPKIMLTKFLNRSNTVISNEDFSTDFAFG